MIRFSQPKPKHLRILAIAAGSSNQNTVDNVNWWITREHPGGSYLADLQLTRVYKSNCDDLISPQMMLLGKQRLNKSNGEQIPQRDGGGTEPDSTD